MADEPRYHPIEQDAWVAFGDDSNSLFFNFTVGNISNGCGQNPIPILHYRRLLEALF